jgi:two-component sensor histidine kinase
MWNSLLNIGIKNAGNEREKGIIRKLNFIAILGTLNVFAAGAIYCFLGLYDVIVPFLIILIICPFVFVFNHKWGYITASYMFFIVTAILLFYFTLLFGVKSMVFMYFFPAFFFMIHMFGRREVKIHMIIMSVLYTIGIIACVALFWIPHKGYFSDEQCTVIAACCTVLSFITSLALFIMGLQENCNQQEKIEKMLDEKNVLLSEIYHRVKNNLSIVTGLINMKKNTVETPEAIDALEDCRSRIYSIAMIHQYMMTSEEVGVLDFKEYVSDLVYNIDNSLGDEGEVSVFSNPVQMPLSQAVPCGLIINELVTNAFKHAKVPGRRLKIEITVSEKNGLLNIELADNGPGNFVSHTEKDEKALGFELVVALSEQLEASLSSENKNGHIVRLSFKLKSHKNS